MVTRRSFLAYVFGFGATSMVDRNNKLSLPTPNEPYVDKLTGKISEVWYRSLKDVVTGRNSQKRVLTEDTTFVVVNATGDDINGDGSTAKPFATPQGAYDYCLQNIDANGYYVKIRINDSVATTYTSTEKRRHSTEFSSEFTVLTIAANIVGAAAVEFEAAGQATTPDFSGNRITFDANGGTAVFISAASGTFIFQGMRLTDSSASKGDLFFSNTPCVILWDALDFGDAHWHCHIGPGTVLKIFGDYSISGSAAIHILLETGYVDHEVSNVYFKNTPTFSTAYVYAANMSCYAFLQITFDNTFTGTRYLIQDATIVATNDPDLNDFLPGSLPGNTIINLGGGLGRLYSNTIENLASGSNATAFTLGVTATLVQIENLGTGADGLFWVGAGNAVTKVAGDASFEASTTPAGGNSGFGWSGSAYKIYNNTGVARTYSLLVHMTAYNP